MTDRTSAKPARRMARTPADKAAPEAVSITIQAAEIAAPPPRTESKIALITRLLERAEGATLGEMVGATGWLPHTTRAALTRLRKKGKVITKGERDDVTCYFIAGLVA